MLQFREVLDAAAAAKVFKVSLSARDRASYYRIQQLSNMEVSRQTYGRILARARRCISDALVTGKALRIEGGDYEFRGRGMRRRRGGGRGRGHGRGRPS